MCYQYLFRLYSLDNSPLPRSKKKSINIKINLKLIQVSSIFYLLFCFFFNFYFIFKLYKIVLVLPNIKMNLPQVYMCSPSWTLLPPPSPYHPSRSSHCTSPKYPVSCIEPGLATRFIHDILHVSMPFSQTNKQTPPLPPNPITNKNQNKPRKPKQQQ